MPWQWILLLLCYIHCKFSMKDWKSNYLIRKKSSLSSACISLYKATDMHLSSKLHWLTLAYWHSKKFGLQVSPIYLSYTHTLIYKTHGIAWNWNFLGHCSISNIYVNTSVIFVYMRAHLVMHVEHMVFLFLSFSSIPNSHIVTRWLNSPRLPCKLNWTTAVFHCDNNMVAQCIMA